ncbi:ABC-type sugar transport system, substrate-binding protein, contains N-terminal xre family HTH domain [Flavobacterium glycines]|uniref:histidine kinase n=2 Tax=Flavobacterium glycines TaxID=551990 RepID=A0A1B9DRI0_9FLAO|nr:substrate-binding domain-containing protein [Flavobacterium glycines]OCB72302.1 AraC family transcriptional regulator [Flavobacterium glycines]SDI94336.1 ABC-type sugar transport system, substrate-binding protein, contains N-terminal xre family HTH domain [Flavobacterium glycines]
MFKKICFLFLLVLILNSCKNEEDKDEILIGFSQSINHDIWRKSMEHSMEIEAALHPNVKLKIYNANRKSKKQIKDIERFIEEKVDAIIVSPFESDSIIPVIEKANAKGIPVIVVDRKVNTSNYMAYIGADNVEVGRIAGRHIVSLSKGKAKVIEVRGAYYTSPGLERSLGFKEIVEQYSGIKVVRLDAYKDELPKEAFLKALTENPDVDYVFAYNDVIAYQAYLVAKSKKLEKKIKIIGVDGINGPYGGIQLVKDGILKATVLYLTGGSEAVKLALKVINKEIVPKKNNLNTVLIDSLNAEIMSNQFDKITIQQSDIEEQQHIIKNQEEKYASQSNLLKLLIILFVIVFGLAIYSIYSRITISRKKNELEEKNKKIVIQRNEIKQFAKELKKSNEARLLFFTGLSHEFKTPLTLILSSVESLKNEFRNKGIAVNTEINLMYNNSRRLLRLINQLLDYRKIEDKKFVLKASKTNILDFSKSIVCDFEKEAKRKLIDFTLTSNNPDLEVYIDRNLMDKVYFNLLSNAFKFTPESGKIAVAINEDKIHNVVRISFKDSGIGIPENEIEEVFKAFYQGSNNYRSNSSGIGLHLSKNFIDLHKGKVEINSKNGTEFIISLPLGKEHLDAKSIIEDQVLDLIYQSDYLDSDIQVSEPMVNEDKYSIFYIEDNVDLLDFITNKFSTQYTIYTSDGTDAIERALELIPDVIICDLNLHDKNGFEICEILKKDLRTSHIPIIILTASEDQDSYLKALESGADIFLTKPFDLKVLSQSIKGLLYNREKLRFYYTNNILKIDDSGFGFSEQDFLRKLNSLIEKNMENSAYLIEDLAHDLNISRVQLYRKVKAILGISVSDHLLNLRLEKSKILLKKTNQNISEIAYAVGFSSPNYFSTSFKNKFGVTPTEYKGVK